jgi:hypothetical protein
LESINVEVEATYDLIDVSEEKDAQILELEAQLMQLQEEQDEEIIPTEVEEEEKEEEEVT